MNKCPKCEVQRRDREYQRIVEQMEMEYHKQLMIRYVHDMITIKLLLLTGKCIKIYISKHLTVFDVMCEVTLKEGIPPAFQRLIMMKEQKLLNKTKPFDFLLLPCLHTGQLMFL